METQTHTRLDDHTFKYYHIFIFTLKHIISHNSHVHSHRNMLSHTHILNSQTHPPTCIHSNTPTFTLTHYNTFRHAHTDTHMHTNLNYLFILIHTHTQTQNITFTHSHRLTLSHASTHTHIFTNISQVHTHIQAHPPICLHMTICTCFYTYLLIQTLMHTHMYMYCICTLAHSPTFKHCKRINIAADLDSINKTRGP